MSDRISNRNLLVKSVKTDQMTYEQQSIWKKIQYYNFTGLSNGTFIHQIKNFSFSGDNSHWTIQMIKEFKKFMFVTFISSETTPSTIIDEVWHLMITNTSDYIEFCKSCGRMIYHMPEENESDKGRFDNNYTNTLKLLKKYFKFKPQFWPNESNDTAYNKMMYVDKRYIRSININRYCWKNLKKHPLEELIESIYKSSYSKSAYSDLNELVYENKSNNTSEIINTLEMWKEIINFEYPLNIIEKFKKAINYPANPEITYPVKKKYKRYEKYVNETTEIVDVHYVMLEYQKFILMLRVKDFLKKQYNISINVYPTFLVEMFWRTHILYNKNYFDFGFYEHTNIYYGNDDYTDTKLLYATLFSSSFIDIFKTDEIFKFYKTDTITNNISTNSYKINIKRLYTNNETIQTTTNVKFILTEYNEKYKDFVNGNNYNNAPIDYSVFSISKNTYENINSSKIFSPSTYTHVYPITNSNQSNQSTQNNHNLQTYTHVYPITNYNQSNQSNQYTHNNHNLRYGFLGFLGGIFAHNIASTIDHGGVEYGNSNFDAGPVINTNDNSNLFCDFNNGNSGGNYSGGNSGCAGGGSNSGCAGSGGYSSCGSSYSGGGYSSCGSSSYSGGGGSSSSCSGGSSSSCSGGSSSSCSGGSSSSCSGGSSSSCSGGSSSSCSGRWW